MSYKNYIIKLNNKFIQSYENGDFLKTILTGERILKIYEDNKDTDCEDYNRMLSDVAYIYMRSGKYIKARTMYISAFNFFYKNKPNSLILSDIANNLGITHNHCGDMYGCTDCFNIALDIRKEHLPNSMENYCISLYNMGSLLFDLEKYENASDFFRHAINLHKKNDDFYIDCIDFIGYCFEETKKFEKACECFEEANALIIKIFGDESILYLQNIYYTASLYVKAKNYVEARACFEKSIHLIKQKLGVKHPFYAEALNKAASVYMFLSNEKRALILRQKAINILKNTIGENHLYYASSLKGIGDNFMKLNEYGEAIEVYKKAIEIKERITGNDCLNCFYEKLSLSRAYKNLEKYEDAIDVLKEYIENPPENEDMLIEFLTEISYIYILMDKKDELYNIYRKLTNHEPDFNFEQMSKDIKNSDYFEYDFNMFNAPNISEFGPYEHETGDLLENGGYIYNNDIDDISKYDDDFYINSEEAEYNYNTSDYFGNYSEEDDINNNNNDDDDNGTLF